MADYGYSKRHLYKDAVRRRLFLLRRALTGRHPPSDTKASAATVYWVGDDNTDWNTAANWAISSGGVGGVPTAGVPKTTTNVIFDGNHTHGCVLGGNVTCYAFTIDDSAGTPVASFDMSGKNLTVGNTFAYDVADDATVVLDGQIAVQGLTLTVTAMHATAAAAWTGAVLLQGACTVASAVAMPQITAMDDFTTTAALEVARLITAGGASDLTFFHGVNFTLTAYTNATVAEADDGDWDGCTIVSDDASTWGFVNPASMVVSNINVEDSNATNVIDATDNCVDGTGNTNWTFV